jgi:hypothetical protein
LNGYHGNALVFETFSWHLTILFVDIRTTIQIKQRGRVHSITPTETRGLIGMTQTADTRVEEDWQEYNVD